MSAADGCSLGRAFLHLVRPNIYRLCESELEFALRAAALQDLSCLVVLCLPDSCNFPSYRTVARSTCFLTIDAEIGVVCKKIEIVAESLDDCAGEIPRFWHGKVVEGFVNGRVRAILAF